MKHEKHDVVLGETKVSPNFQIAVIMQVRPWLKVKPGDKLRFIMTNDGKIFLEKVT